MNKYSYKLYILMSIFGLVTLSACIKSADRDKEVHQEGGEVEEILSNVDAAFRAGRDFSTGKVTDSQLRVKFDVLDAQEKQELIDKEDGSATFVVFLVMGTASDLIAKLLQDTFKITSRNTEQHAVADNMIDALIKAKRPVGEKPEAHLSVLNIVLNKFPSCVNALRDTKGEFQSALFNRIVDAGDAASLKPILEKMKPKTCANYVEWATGTAPESAAFKALYVKAPATVQETLRSELLSRYLKEPVATRHAGLVGLIDNADAWGIGGGLDVDHYRAPSFTKGSFFTGSFLRVLARVAIDEYGTTGSTSRATFKRLRKYAKRLKSRFGDMPYRAHVNASSVALQSIRNSLVVALRPNHFEDWANYYLAIEDVDDVFRIVQKAPTDVSNAMVRELYSAIIVDAARAHDLSLQPLVPAARFLHHVVIRPIDKHTTFLVNDFLTKASNGVAAAEKLLVQDNTGGKNPLQIVSEVSKRPNPEDDLEKANIVARLLSNDSDGKGVLALSIAELEKLAERAFQEGGNAGRGQGDFRRLYETMTAARNDALAKADAANEALATNNMRALRNKLVTMAVAQPAPALQTLVDAMVDTKNPTWGLGAGIATDDYLLGADAKKFSKGSLLWVLAERARGINTPAAYEELRGFAKSIKSRLGDAPYQLFATNVLGLNGGKSVRKELKTVLNASGRKSFANYYLAIETPKDVYDATLMPIASMPNSVLKQLYELVIRDVPQLAVDLAAYPTTPGVHDRFLHGLIRRGADVDTRELVNKFLSAVSTSLGMANEPMLLRVVDTAGEGVLKNFVKVGRKHDDAGKRAQILGRLLQNADGTIFAGVTPDELTALTPILKHHPSVFKKLYQLFNPLSREARALRSALLEDALAQTLTAETLLREFADSATDKWGVQAAITDETHKFKIATIPAGGFHRGPLLEVLVNRKIDEMAAAPVEAMRDLRKLAVIIKKAYGDRAQNYDNFTTVTVFALGGKTIKQTLVDALAPSGRRLFANSFLAREQPADVFDAAQEPEVIVTNEMLRTLYLSVVGHNLLLVDQLAKLGGGGADAFIHHLVRRKVDASGESAKILKLFLDDLSVVEKKNQIHNVGSGLYPLQVLADPLRVAADDDAKAKVSMFDELLKDDGGTALATLTENNFFAQRCFMGAEAAGLALFKTLYNHAAIAPDASKQRGLRSSLLNEAYSLGKVTALVSDLVFVDSYGFGATLNLDSYRLEQDPVGAPPHEGNLLYVITKRAIQTATRTASHDSYRELRLVALELRKKFLPVDYVTFATDPMSDAVAALKVELDKPNLFGLAEYYLDMDERLATFNEHTVFAASKNVVKNKVFDSAILQWLYKTVIVDNAKAQALMALHVAGERFIHRVVAQDLSDAINDILEDYLLKLSAAGYAAGAVADVNGAAPPKNALQIILTPSRGGAGVKKAKLDILATLAKYADGPTLQTIGANLTPVLKAVRQLGAPGDFGSVVHNLADASIPVFVEFCGEIYNELNRTKFGGGGSMLGSIGSGTYRMNDNLENADVQAAFHAEYLARPLMQQTMRDSIVRTAFDVGALTSTPTAALERVGLMLEKDFLVDPTGANYAPFSTPGAVIGPSTLLYAVLKKTEKENFKAQAQIRNMVVHLKAKFPVPGSWQTYLNDTTNDEGKTVVEMLRDNLSMRGIANAQGVAENWLDY